MPGYKHASDYLLELANGPNTPGWLSDLIVRTVEKDGELDDADIAMAAEQMKAKGSRKLAIEKSRLTADDTIRISLIELRHHCGVNALAREQTITFSPDITLLYGNNGSGKSSYFRILNEIVGGSRTTNIYPNIYAEVQDEVNVELRYRIEGQDHEKVFKWDGKGRMFPPLNNACMFDSGYKDLLLEKRSADTAMVHPMGLHLFEALTTAIDRVKEHLGTEVVDLKGGLPRIVQNHLSQMLRNMLAEQSYDERLRKTVEACYEMDRDKRCELDGCIKKIDEINATNYDDKIKLVEIDKHLIEGLLDYIVNTLVKLQELEKAVNELAVRKANASQESDKTWQKIKILKEIGDTRSEEWKAFIASGADFVQASHLSVRVCPYCRQELKGEAIDIVRAYADFLSDQSQTTRRELLHEQSRLKMQIETMKVNGQLSERIDVLLGKAKEQVLEALSALARLRESLMIKIDNLSLPLDEMLPNINTTLNVTTQAIGRLQSKVAGYKGHLANLKKERDGKTDELRRLMQTRNTLLEHQAIAEQKEKFEQWFGKLQRVHHLERCQQETSTRMVSALAKTAAQHLLTESLRDKFQEELNALGLERLRVSLSEMGASSGQAFMQIKLAATDYNTREILSEGEQKGIALALFLAERRMHPSHNPIILDDPVNSLDHVYTARFIGRLVQLGNQIVIFSHNILLKDSLLGLPGVHECSKDQIGSCKSTGKHLYLYKVRSRSRMEKGCICNSKNDTVKNMLEGVQRTLRKDDFTDDDSISCASQMRMAIEKLIDDRVFRNLSPLKYRGGTQQTINWERMKTLHGDATLIDQLHRCYNRLSGGDLHENTQRRENPMDLEELNEVFNELKSYAN